MLIQMNSIRMFSLFLETFRNCADVAITSNTGGIPPLFIGKNNPFLLYYRDYRAPDDENVFPLVVKYVLSPYDLKKKQ